MVVERQSGWKFKDHYDCRLVKYIVVPALRMLYKWWGNSTIVDIIKCTLHQPVLSIVV